MKTLLSILAVLAFAPAVFAQNFQAPANNGNIVVQTCGTAPANYPAVDTGTPNRAPNIVDANGNICTTATVTPATGATTSVNISSVGSVAVATNGSGVIAVAGASSAGLIVTTAVCSGTTCYTSPVYSGIVTLAASTSSAPFGTVTTALDDGSSCINQTASAATLFLSDGNTAYLAQAFSIPANSLLSLRDFVGTIFTSGIKATSGTASAIVCRFRGKQ